MERQIGFLALRLTAMTVFQLGNGDQHHDKKVEYKNGLQQ